MKWYKMLLESPGIDGSSQDIGSQALLNKQAGWAQKGAEMQKHSIISIKYN